MNGSFSRTIRGKLYRKWEEIISFDRAKNRIIFLVSSLHHYHAFSKTFHFHTYLITQNSECTLI